ncbi:hypothetical protein DFH28DRAFT_1086207 [Melampsora americana]|nr:hypothetical protein DFH28DRAFT_1086207 [Melampsora americana]
MPITGHPFHLTGNQVVANLEHIADIKSNGLHTPSQCISTNTNTTNVPSTATNQPPRKCNKTKTKGKSKSNKQKRNNTGSRSETKEEPVFDPADLNNSDKTVFHKELQTMILIKALKLATAVSPIETVFGKYIGACRPLRWNRFLQSLRAREVFKAAQGVGSGEGMRQLSVVWKSMAKAEKDVYKEATQEIDWASLQAMDKDLAELEVGAQSRNQTLQSGSNTVVNPRSLKNYKDNADRYLDDIMRKVIGVTKIVKEIYAMDGFNDFATEVQAHLTGPKPGEMTKSKSVTSFTAEWLQETFKSVSSNISRAKLLALESDLENNLIRMAPLNQSTPAQPQTPAQAQHTENTENTTDTSTTRLPLSDTLDPMSSETVSY